MGVELLGVRGGRVRMLVRFVRCRLKLKGRELFRGRWLYMEKSSFLRIRLVFFRLLRGGIWFEVMGYLIVVLNCSMFFLFLNFFSLVFF